MKQFDPANEKIEQAHVELKEANSESELIPSPSHRPLADPPKELPITEHADMMATKPWIRHQQKNSLASGPLENPNTYAGFWRRLAANAVDLLISNAILATLINVFFVVYAMTQAELLKELPAVLLYLTALVLGNPVNLFLFIGLGPLTIPIGLIVCPDPSRDYLQIFLLSTLVWWCLPLVDWNYHAIMESSRKQATFGKMLLRIHVSDANGQPITLLRAYARYISKLISGLTLLAGFIAIGLTGKKQGFHDKIARTFILKD